MHLAIFSYCYLLLFAMGIGFSQPQLQLLENQKLILSDDYDEIPYNDLYQHIQYIKKHFKSIGRAKAITSIEEIIKASEKFIKQKDYLLRAKSYNLLGKIYYSNQDYKKALKNHKISELFINELDDAPLLAIELSNDIASVYINGYNKPAKALRRIRQIYEGNHDLDPETKQILALNLARIYIKAKNYKKAMPLLDNCKIFFSQNKKYIPKLVVTNMAFGEYYHQSKNYNRAIDFYKLAAEQADANALYVQALHIYSKYEKLLLQIGRKDLAYQVLKQYSKHHQTAWDAEKAEADEYKQQLIASNRIKDIEQQKAEQSKTISIFTLCLLSLCLVLFCFFIYHYNKTKALGKAISLRNKELKLEKEKSDELAAVKTKFISTVSHELRTPLYGVIGLSSILMEKIKDKEQHKFIKLMKFSADHLLNLINDVLQVTKMESYKISLTQAPFNIKTLADDIKNSFEYQTIKNNNSLHLNFDENIPENLVGDAVRLSQILINLISNANKFTKNGDIWLNFINPKLEADQVELTFEIQDNGRGIPLDKQELIFEKFSQANTTDHAKGTGLGLNIVQKLVNLHGGDIQLRSTPNVGSTFYFTIRLDIHKAIQNKENSKARVLDYIRLNPSDTYNILIVEDNKINQIVTQNILKTKGYQSEIAEDGLVALDMVHKKSYDLILMDLHMPNMGGMEATKKIREFDRSTPIVALTASDTEDTIKEILHIDSGFSDYMKKPFKNTEFFQKIETNLLGSISQAS